ncbi:MAG: hypothetical protein ACRD6R_11520, partial [Candidatus Polarisedimenticolia bacterium]
GHGGARRHGGGNGRHGGGGRPGGGAGRAGHDARMQSILDRHAPAEEGGGSRSSLPRGLRRRGR